MSWLHRLGRCTAISNDLTGNSLANSKYADLKHSYKSSTRHRCLCRLLSGPGFTCFLGVQWNPTSVKQEQRQSQKHCSVQDIFCFVLDVASSKAFSRAHQEPDTPQNKNRSNTRTPVNIRLVVVSSHKKVLLTHSQQSKRKLL